MECKNLQSTSIEIIHTSFIDAFSEYEVKIDMPIEKFTEMLLTRSFSPEISLGCFDNDHLVGFILIGLRYKDNNKIAYDIATGVINEYQNKQIGSLLIQKLKKVIKEYHISQFQLEVLEHNKPAQRIYEKNGFIVSRKFTCYSLVIDTIFKEKNVYSIKAIDNIIESNKEIYDYMSFLPSWQNEKQSYLICKEKYKAIGIIENDQIIGYGIVHISNGSVLQLGVKKEYWNQGIEQTIVHTLAKSTAAKQLRFSNIEEYSYEDTILKSIGAKTDVNQYEMIYLNTNFT